VSYRDLVVAITILSSLPFCFLQPWIGVLVWSWIGYMNPHRLTWDFAYHQPWAMMVAIATLTGLLFAGRDRKPVPRTAAVYLLIALWAVFVVSTFGAFEPKDAWDQLDKVSKILLITFVTMVLFRDPVKIRYLLYVIALSIGFFGLKGGIWALATGGGNMVLGPPESFIAGNTEIGLAIIMVIPLLLLLSRHEPRHWARVGLRVMMGFSVVAVLFTYSRGAVLGLGVILPLMFLKSRMRMLILPLALVAALFGQAVVESVFPERWLARMGTVQTYERDRSANMRLNSWIVSFRLARDYPFFGAGFRPFSAAVYLTYSPDEKWNTLQDSHSIYFQVMAEHGFVGFGLYVGVIAATLLALRGIMWRTRRRPALKFYFDCAQMIEVSLLGFLTAGAFLSMSYFDLFFHLVAVTALVKVLVAEKLAQEEAAPASSPVPARVPVRTTPRGPAPLPSPSRALSFPRPRPAPRP
jgi:probable O-glycosylation ligase (exosortase A-associated)